MVTAPVNEIGYAQAVNYNWWLYEDETTPELIWPQSVSVYDTMRRTDSQVASVLRAVTLPVRRTPWRIDPAGASERVTKFVADDLGLPILGQATVPALRMKDKFSWADHLRQALLMLVFGHMYFEQVYRPNDAGTEMHLRKLAPRMPKTIERIDVAPDGGLISISQWWTKVDARPEPIPVNRLVAYVHDKEGGNWLGQSLLRPAYKHWLIKDRLLRVQAQTIERNGMGIPLYEGAEGEVDLSAGLGMATSWRAGEAAGSAVPFGAKLRLVGVEGQLPDAEPAIRYHDEQIARGTLAHFLNLGSQTGSWALGTTFADFFVLSLQTLAQQLADTASQHIVEDLVDYNFGEEEPAPRIVFDEIGSRQAATAQALKLLVDAGIVKPDQVLEEMSRQQYGLPAADPATATPPPSQQGVTPPEPTQMGDTSPSVAAKSAPKGRAASAAGDDGLFPLPKSHIRRSREKSKPVRARYDPAQTRDPNGEWGDAAPGAGLPELDMEGFDLTSEVEGTFGTLAMGIDSAGDVRLAFHEGNDARAVDLSADDVAELRDAVSRLADSRDDLDGSVNAGEIVDDEWFGGDREHKVELLGNGIISVVFGAEDDDPWTLLLDPPDEGGDSDDAQAVLDGLDDVENELAGKVEAKADTHPGGEQLKHWWVYGPGAARWSTFTELYRELRSEIEGKSDKVVKAIAASWFHLRFGYWPGDHVHAKYNLSQLRDPGGENGGQWVSGPAGALKDTLKLAGKIDLAPDEKLLGSAKVDGDIGGIRMALTEQGGRRMLRLGVGGDGYGKADRDTGTPAWDGNPARDPLPEADRQRLDAEFDALSEEYDAASPARQAEIADRQDEIKELLPGPDDGEFGGTAKLDEYSMRRLADKIRPALAEAVGQDKAQNDAWDEIEALEAKGNPDPDRMARLREIARADATDSITFTQGILPGSEWGDVHYSVELDDPSVGPYVMLGVQPTGAPDDWGDGRDWKGQFDAGETRKFLGLLDKFTKTQAIGHTALPPERG